MTPEEIEDLWPDFEFYVRKVRGFVSLGGSQATVKLFFEFLEWREHGMEQ